MEKNNKKGRIGTAIGYSLLSCVPLLIFMLIQIGVAALLLLCLTFCIAIGHHRACSEMLDAGLLLERVMTIYRDNVIWVSVVYQIVALVVFGLWYYLVWGQKRLSSHKILTSQSIGKIILLGLSFEFFINNILSLVEHLFPSIMEEYKQMMENAGLNDISLVAALATIIMAPIVEELAFRGVTFRLALHITGRNSLQDNTTFWIANVIQALLFGIGHLNLIQGSYAFVLGIVMGYVIRKYHTIYASMLLHAVFNFSGTILAGLVYFIPYANTLWGTVLLIMAGGMLCCVTCRIIKEDKI